MKPLTPTTPHVIIMVGIPGAGKTAFAEQFAKTFHAPYINPSMISEQTGTDEDATEKVTQLFFNELLKTKQTLIYEGSTYAKAQRIAIVKLIAKAGYRPLIVWVQTEPTEAKRRAISKSKKGARLSPDEFDDALSRFQAPSDVEKAVVISGRHTFATQVKVVLKRLATTTRPERPSLPQPPTPPTKPRPTGIRNITIR